MLEWCIQYSLYFSSLFLINSADATVPFRFPRTVEAEILRSVLVDCTSDIGNTSPPTFAFVGRVVSYDPWRVEDIAPWVLPPLRSDVFKFRPFSQSQLKSGGGNFIEDKGTGERGVRISIGKVQHDDNRATVSKFVDWGGLELCGYGDSCQISLVRYGGVWWIIRVSDWKPDK